MTSLIAPSRLADTVRRRIATSTDEVSAYWMTITGDREVFAEALRNELEDDPVVVLVLRDNRFTNANALLSDFVELVSENRDICEQCLNREFDRCGFILLSRAELTIPQVSSPVILPPWFPISGGKTISMLIEDVTWTTDAPLAASESRIGELCEQLLDLESSIIDRIRVVRADDHRKVGGLLQVIRREEGETLEGILDAAAEHQDSVTTPTAYRPSVRDAKSLISRIWAVVQERQPDQMKPPSRALAEALDLPEQFESHWHESLTSVLRRPPGGEPDARLRFARNILVTVATTCQLVTAAAHADDYEHYSVLLLRTYSFDLRRSLADAESALRALGP